ncbi:MAG: carbohydrate-binding protein, partial [Candidatus Izimaplasma sp.]|nr:carbohydrate-binding protein [Candidatus Izimaplasma bacterium]
LNVGWIDSNDKLEYSLLVEESGTYILDSRCASLDGGGKFDFLQDGTVLTTVNIDSTSGWQTWDNFQSDTFYLEAGVYTFTIDVQFGGFNINYFDFKKVN